MIIIVLPEIHTFEFHENAEHKITAKKFQSVHMLGLMLNYCINKYLNTHTAPHTQ